MRRLVDLQSNRAGDRIAVLAKSSNSSLGSAIAALTPSWCHQFPSINDEIKHIPMIQAVGPFEPDFEG
jgi:hypothetical protein